MCQHYRKHSPLKKGCGPDVMAYAPCWDGREWHWHVHSECVAKSNPAGACILADVLHRIRGPRAFLEGCEDGLTNNPAMAGVGDSGGLLNAAFDECSHVNLRFEVVNKSRCTETKSLAHI